MQPLYPNPNLNLRQGLPGVKIVEGDEEVSWYKRWNPIATTPIQIFATHASHKTKAVNTVDDRCANHLYGNLNPTLEPAYEPGTVTLPIHQTQD